LVRKKSGPDLSAYVSKSFGLDLDKLDKEWLAFTAMLKAK
jgi:hypothetical protein